MQLVIEWVTNIILFLLFAIIIDFLLPSGTMQKYVKMAVGLMLVLVMLAPVLRLASVDPEQLIASALVHFSNGRAGEEAIKNQIEQQKKEIQASQRAYILKQMAVQLENDVNEELMEKYGLKADVNVYAKPGDDWRMPDDIKTIEVVLSKQKSAGSVEPVVIDTTKPPALPEGDASLAEEVRAFLAGRWEIDEDKIDVQFRGGNRGGMLPLIKRLFSSAPKDGEGAQKKWPFSYVVVLLLAGVALMAASHWANSGEEAEAKPSAGQPSAPAEPAFLASKETKEKVIAAYEERYEKELKAALEAIEGVDDVTVVVNLDSTELKLYEKKRSTQQQTTEESDKEGGKRTIENESTNEEVIIIHNGEEETPLVVATKKPDIRGVLVVAKGADNLQIKKWIVEAVTRVLNVPSYRVAVLPKK